MSNQDPNSDPSKQIKITNNSGKSVVVMIPTTSTTPDSPSDIMVYGERLEILTSMDGNQSIPDSGNATFVLNQYYTDSKTGQQRYSLVYDLLISRADWYNPVANIGVMQNFSPPSYSPQTVTADQARSLQNAAVFHQTISAYPTSQLTTDYKNALNSTQSAASAAADGSEGSSDNVANAITGGTDKFFKSTKSFQNVTLAGVVAVENYYRAFPFVWAQYGNTTYYLYSSDGKTTSFAGTIALTQPSTVDPSKPNGGYTCTFAPASDPTDTTKVDVDSSKSKSLTYSDGLFVDDADVDIPNIAVKGTFQLKRQFTQKSGDTQIIPVLTGTVNGSICIGFDAPQKSDDKENSAFWNALFHPKNSAEIFKSVMEIGGAFMMLVFFGQLLVGGYRWVRSLGAAKEPTTAELFKAQQESFEKAFKEYADAVNKKISNNQQEAPDNPESASESITDARGTMSDNLDAGRLQDGLASEAGSLEEMAEFAADMTSDQLQTLQDLGGRVQDSNTALNDATPETLPEVVTAQETAFDGIRGDVSSFASDVSQTISEEAARQIEANSAVSQEISEDIKDAEEASEGETTDEDPDAGEPIEPIEV